jgi:hypothetical protein
VARCLLITQRTSVLEREPQFIPHVHPCGRTVLKSQLKWSTAWWRGARFYHRRSDDRVVVDEVPIGGHVGPSIGSIVAGCLTTTWNVVAEFLRFWGNSKPIAIVRCASCSWARCSRLSSCTTLLIVEMDAQHCFRAPLWMTMFLTGTACPSETYHHRSTIPWVGSKGT